MEENGGAGNRQNHLLKVLGFGFGLAMVVGSAVGVSIFRLPGSVVELLGSFWLVIFVWILGGAFTLASANFYSELATMFPEAGGPFVYARRAFGDYAGFAVGWLGWLGDTAAVGFMSLAFGEFSTKLFNITFPGAVPALAISGLLAITVLNWTGVRAGSGAQKFLSLIKALTLIGFVGVCFAFGAGAPDGAAFVPQFAGSPVFAFVMAFQLVVGAYGGWHTVIFFAEEDTDPSRNIPRSLHFGILLVIGLYLLVNAALYYALPIPQLAGSKLAAADAIGLITGTNGSTLITILALISTIGVLNAVVLFIPRTLYGLGRAGLFTKKALIVNSGGTPVFALGFGVLVAVILQLTGSFETLLAMYAFFSIAVNIVLLCALFALRLREPELPRPFRTTAYPYVPVLLLAISGLFLVGYIASDTRNSLYATVAAIISYPLYRLVKKRNSTRAE